MEHILEFNEFKETFLNEGNLSKISDEELVDAYKRSSKADEDKAKSFSKELKKRGFTTTELDDFLKESLNEAVKYDIEAVLKDFREFNRHTISPKKHAELGEKLEDLARIAIKNLGLKLNSKNVDAVIDHIGMSMDDKGKIPVDKDLVKELYAIAE